VTALNRERLDALSRYRTFQRPSPMEALIVDLLDTVDTLQAKWDFEHELANDLQKEVERLDTEVIWLQDYGRIPQLEALLRAIGPCVRHCDQHAASFAGRIDAALGPTEYTVHHPSYVVPPADPQLANPEKHR